MNTSAEPEELLTEAQAGSTAHLGRLLELYRHYLRLLARMQVGQRLQAKVDASDLVQETMLEAHKSFPGFRGSSEAQFVAWLRQIMAAVLCNLVRRYLGTQGRDVRLERDLREHVDRSSLLLARGFADPHSSPSQQAARREQAVLLADALHRFLSDEPIRARRPSLLDRSKKWARRHPSFVGAVLAMMFLTLIISGVSNWLIGRANIRTQAALQAERLRAEEAEKRFAQARKAVDLLIEVSENDLADKPPLQPLQRRLLETALVYYQDFIAQHHGNAASEAELVSVQRRLKKVLDDLSVMEGAGQLVLLADKGVQADLALGEAERRRVDSLARQFSQQALDLLRGFDQLPPMERRARFLELARSNENAMRSILNERQVKRLQQINLQREGLRAFNQPEVVTTLKLTEAQRQALRQIEIETYVLWRDPWNQTDQRHRRDLEGDLFQAAMDKSLAVLTPSQLSQWNEMTGPPFQGRLPMGPRGMRPPP